MGQERKEKDFESFEDMKNRIQNLADPEKAIQKRILTELINIERHNFGLGSAQGKTILNYEAKGSGLSSIYKRKRRTTGNQEYN